jgi:hypothetical protein
MKQHYIKISKRSADLKNIIDSKDKHGVWKNVKGNIKLSATERLYLYEYKQHKPWFDEECSLFCIKGSRLKCSGYRIQTKAI